MPDENKDNRFNMKLSPALRQLLDLLAREWGTTRVGALGHCISFSSKSFQEQKSGADISFVRGSKVKTIIPPWGEVIQEGATA